MEIAEGRGYAEALLGFEQDASSQTLCGLLFAGCVEIRPHGSRDARLDQSVSLNVSVGMIFTRDPRDLLPAPRSFRRLPRARLGFSDFPSTAVLCLGSIIPTRKGSPVAKGVRQAQRNQIYTSTAESTGPSQVAPGWVRRHQRATG